MCVCVCERERDYLEHQNSQSGFCTASVNMVGDGRGAAASEIIISISYHLTGVLLPAGAVC